MVNPPLLISTYYSCKISINLSFSQHSFESTQISNFMEIRCFTQTVVTGCL